jgi:hypothetical protein
VTELVKTLRSKGFKSDTACRIIANGILRKPDEAAKEASLKEKIALSPEKKEKLEVQAKAYHADQQKKKEEKKQQGG